MSSNLNPRQREAIEYIQSPLLVLAGAGSGKTRVITQKIAWLVNHAGIPARHIAAVTFTNKAAREMKSRVGEILKGKAAKGLTVSTFHTLGLQIIRREIKSLGFKNNITILDAQDCEGLIKGIIDKGFTADEEYTEQCQQQIGRWKNAMILPKQALESATEEQEFKIAQIYNQYENQLRAFNAVDFDDLITVPARLFADNEEVLERWQNRIHYLLVDEYQDTNTSQYQLVKLLTGVRGALTVVGDDDQSIYAWRGAEPENLALLAKDYPRLKVIKLEQNYRSSNRILTAANKLIGLNPHVFEKRLWSDKGMGDPIKVLVTKNGEEEAKQVIAQLINHRFLNQADYGEYAILYRGNHQARIFEHILTHHKIPYYLSGGTSFFARAEIKDIMAYLRLIVNPDDDSAFLRIANVPRREIGSSTLEKLGNYANTRQVSLFDASNELGLTEVLSPRTLENVQRFTLWIDKIAYRSTTEEVIPLVREVISSIGYEHWLKDTCKDIKTAEKRMENVNRLVTWLEKLQEEEDKNLGEIVSHFALMDVLERQNEEKGNFGVALMTLHAAKGLEFPYVYMIGMEEELLPHRNSMESETGIQEERRLTYVGITRAQKHLTLTYARRRKRYDEMISCDPSRFIKELPQEDLVWEGDKIKSDKPPEEKKAIAKAHLSHLKDMLRK